MNIEQTQGLIAEVMKLWVERTKGQPIGLVVLAVAPGTNMILSGSNMPPDVQTEVIAALAKRNEMGGPDSREVFTT